MRAKALLLLTGLLAGLALPARASTTPARGWVVDRARFESIDADRPLTAEGVGTYRGALEVRPSGGLTVLDDVALEDYLKGISEVPASWPIEAQKAQAIAARTYALYQLLRPSPSAWRAAGADICATDACQVYTGLEKEQRPDGPRWTAAVEATRDQVILWRGGPILAKYSSTNGGASVAGGMPYLRAVADPDDAISPYHHWRHAVPPPVVASLFAVPGELVDAHRDGDTVVFTSRQPDDTQWLGTVPLADFRARLNAGYPAPPGLPLAVPSTRFTVGTTDEGVVVDGWGWGHGIGMSQYGALGKALRGMKAPQILASYYAGLRPVAVPPQRLPGSVKVAVALGRPSVTISSAGRFRVVDGAGHPVATVAGGQWQVLPERGGKVRVVPPPGDDQPLAVTPLDVQPGAPAGLRLQLSVPAVVSLTAQSPGGASVAAPAQVVDRGEHVLPLPVPAAAGLAVTVTADAGAGRAATVPYVWQPPPPRAKPAASGEGEAALATAGPLPVDGRGPWPLVALALLLAAATGVVRVRRP